MKYLSLALSFGITTGIRIYLLGVLLGGWLDRRFGTEPWLMLLGVLAAVFLSFRFLIKQFDRM